MCVYQNVRGLNTKINTFFKSVSHGEYDVVALTETWLQDDVKTSEIFPDEYIVFRKSRDVISTQLNRGGGVLVAAKQHLNAEHVDLREFNSQFPSIDIVACKCLLKFKKLFIFAVYIPPSISLNELEYFFECLEQLDNVFDNKVIIFGDFNVPSFNSPNLNSRDFCIINNFLQYTDLIQCNNIVNDSGRLLDLVFSNIDCQITRDNVPLVEEDLHHPTLNVILNNLSFKNSQPFQNHDNYESFNFRQANYPQLYETILDTDWSFLKGCTDVDNAIDLFYSKIYQMFDKFIPKKKNYRRKFPTWYNSRIINHIKLKEKAFKRYKNNRNAQSYKEFSDLRALIKEEINVAFKNYVSSVESSLKDNPGKFWTYFHNKNNNSRIPGVMNYKDESLQNPKDIVDNFAKFFESVFIESSEPRNEHLSTINPNVIQLDNITYDEIILGGKKLKNKLTSGTDNIPSFLVKDCIGCLAYPLEIIFNKAVKAEKFPSRWKEAKIIPIHKAGTKSEITNYRPITILSNFAKLFEIVVYNRIYFSVKNIISDTQHGFMSLRSTATNLAIITQYISNSLDVQRQVDVIYTDISKAFDRIDHEILIQKINGFGLNKNSVQFIRSYLTNRKYAVFYNGCQSNAFIARSGVPQGSNLGPLLFLMFISDLESVITCEKLFFADDLKIFMEINSTEDCLTLQSNINNVSNWCLANKLDLNIDKCKVISFTRKMSYRIHPYKISENILLRVNSITDLGIIFDQKLTFIEHINNLCSDASKSLGFIIRNCREFTDLNSIKILYFSYVRSKLEYCAIIWNPLYSCHKQLIESIQKRFLKYLVFKEDAIYPDRGLEYCLFLNRFNFESLEFRRKCLSLTFLYKLVHQKINCADLLAQINFHTPKMGSRQHKDFFTRKANTNILIKSPLHFMCSQFNEISKFCDIHFSSLKTIISVASQILK